MSEKTDVVGKMELLARKWHEGQYRKGPERIPYIEHPKAVVGQLKEWGYSETSNPAIDIPRCRDAAWIRGGIPMH